MEETAEGAVKFFKDLKKPSMNDEDFQKLVLSVKQMATIMQGGNFAHRRTTLTELNVKSLRERSGLTQADFSQMIGVSIRTLQN